ncbi:MAG TPA: esterase-like activity of phytase family protein, partial [Polyangiales bacterium]|nr:esterase-like activity of phytase family protein [Polyangiales bacterium]
MRTGLRVWLLGSLLASRASAAPPERPAPHRLVAWAALPQQTRTPGPTSGHFIKPAHGITPPFVDAQPVPGFSGLLPNGDGSFLALPDNGFGSKGNSADYVLGFYQLRPVFKRWGDGTRSPGSVRIESFTAFRDPKGLLKNGTGVDLTLTADRATYYRGDGAGTETDIAIDPAIASARLLTGFDLDVESIARARDGTLWVGDEMGPYLLHFAADGTLLDEPVSHPFLKGPSNPE